MRLKKLVILGFKSFADKTILHFDAGITCIVGPNGCGKSNISDAFRWVLGEQSAKSMRGSKMPDVIFAGTTHRKPLNFAEVSLTLTDIQGALPIDYEEVTLTRRLYRNGESEYLLNGNLVRLKDLQALFLDSGIGRNAFSIFEQGKLDQVISYSPQERRYIFEEAAGILRFLQRKKEALKRLEQADGNLARVQDIHLEVEKQIQNLEKQAHKARLFKEQKSQLEQLEQASYVLKWQALEKKCTDLRKKQVQKQTVLEEIQEQEHLFKQRYQEVKHLVQQQEKALHAQRENVLTIRNQQELQNHENQNVKQRFQEAQQRTRKLKLELEELVLARQTRQTTLGELSRKKQDIEKEWNQAETQWIHQQDRVKAQEQEVVNLRQQLTAKSHAHLKSVQQNNQWQNELKQVEVRLENQTERQKQLESQQQQLALDAQKWVQTVQERKQHLQQMSAQVDSHKDRLDSYEDDLKKLVHEHENKQKESEQLRRKVLESKARQKVLLKMREELEGFSSGGKRLLQEAQNPKSPFYQTLRPLYEWIKPQPEIAEALSVVLRAYTQTLVVERESDFRNILAFAEQEQLQDYSLLCVEWLQNKPSPVSLENSLCHQVASNIVTQHFLATTALVDSHADILPQWLQGKWNEGWSVQGTFFDQRGVLFKIKSSDNQVFIRESELQHLEEELGQKEEELNHLEQGLQQLQHRRSHLQLERTEVDKMLRRDEMKLVEINFGLQRALADQEKNKTDQLQNEKELQLLKDSYAQQKQVYQDLEKQCLETKHVWIQLQEEKEVLQQELDKQEQTLRLQQEEQKEKNSLYQQLADGRQQLTHQVHLLEAKEQDHHQHVQRLEEELLELEERRIKTQQEEQNIQKRLISLDEQLQEAQRLYMGLEDQKSALSQQLEEIEKQLFLQQEDLRRLESENGQLQVQFAQQQAVAEALVNDLAERYNLTMEEALQLPLPLERSLDQTEKQIKSLRQTLQEAGDVNLTAIEDLEKHQIRYGFLKQQMEDMQQSKNELLGIIQQLDGESRKLFQETFEAIRTNFKKNFQILFNGGEADLQFTDSQNVLEAGIEISAKPPGKQMRSISLLSGGEKCLTAVALLFAIFEVKPAPFCILDEIDAPLDDTNVERFVNVVKHFVDRCQFLIITHNKRTMAIGDTLFGISMEEKGVSKLLSLEFAHKAIPEASLV